MTGLGLVWQMYVCTLKNDMGGWCAHMRICAQVFEKIFLGKMIFSHEEIFLWKIYVVLFCINNINICVRMCACTHMRTRWSEFVFLCTYVSFRFFIQITQIGTDAICAHLCFSQHYRSKAHTFAKFIYPQSNIKSLLIFENPHIHSERVNHGRQQEGTGTRWTA